MCVDFRSKVWQTFRIYLSELWEIGTIFQFSFLFFLSFAWDSVRTDEQLKVKFFGNNTLDSCNDFDFLTLTPTLL